MFALVGAKVDLCCLLLLLLLLLFCRWCWLKLGAGIRLWLGVRESLPPVRLRGVLRMKHWGAVPVRGDSHHPLGVGDR